MKCSIRQLFATGALTIATLVLVLAGSAGHLSLTGGLPGVLGSRGLTDRARSYPVPPPPPGLGVDEEERLQPAPPRPDLRGDEVRPALATYGIDPEGKLFEVHSPQTELPKLPGPTT